MYHKTSKSLKNSKVYKIIIPERVHVGDPLYERHQLVLVPIKCLQVMCGPLTSAGGGENHGGDIVQPQQAGQVKGEGLA